jgi:hypothetical protein
MSMLQQLIQPFSDLVRWGEPWDVEDDDLLLDTTCGVDESLSLGI